MFGGFGHAESSVPLFNQSRRRAGPNLHAGHGLSDNAVRTNDRPAPNDYAGGFGLDEAAPSDPNTILDDDPAIHISLFL